MIAVCVILAAVALVVGLAATLLAAALDHAKRQLAATELRLVETTARLHQQRELLSSTEARLAETSVSLAEVTTKYNEAHRVRQLLLAEAGAHRASRWPRRSPGSPTRSGARSQRGSRWPR